MFPEWWPDWPDVWEEVSFLCIGFIVPVEVLVGVMMGFLQGVSENGC